MEEVLPFAGPFPELLALRPPQDFHDFVYCIAAASVIKKPK